jgi:hypothetical protein
MVIPEEREQDFERKMRSPLFSGHFEKDNWSLLYFNALREAFTKTKSRTELASLVGKKKSAEALALNEAPDENQSLMNFGEPQEPAEESLDPVGGSSAGGRAVALSQEVQ